MNWILIAALAAPSPDLGVDPLQETRAFVQSCQAASMAQSFADAPGAKETEAAAIAALGFICTSFISGIAQAVAADPNYTYSGQKICVPATTTVAEFTMLIVSQADNEKMLADPEVTPGRLVLSTLLRQYGCT
jgi:hypothetical protein